jgi:TrmH family RNA methyltransferase
MPDPNRQPLPDPITAPNNPLLARVRALLSRRDRREEEDAFVAEGKRALADAVAAGVAPRLVLLREGTRDGLPRDLPPDTPVRPVAAKVFDGLSEVAAPQGVLAVLPTPFLAIDPDAAPLVLVIDGVRDPGNLGTLLRTAAGAGATAVYLAAETVDPFNPKVVRAAMGAHFRVPLRRLDAEAMETLRADLPLIAVAEADAATVYDALDWTGPAALVVGAEATGVSPAVAAMATDAVSIPLAPGVESLNAAVAGAVLLFEAVRQRRIRG